MNRLRQATNDVRRNIGGLPPGAIAGSGITGGTSAESGRAGRTRAESGTLRC